MKNIFLLQFSLPPLIPPPGRGQHIPSHVQEGPLQAADIAQVDPRKAHLLRSEHAVHVVATEQHQDWVTEIVGHLGQAQLEAPPGVFHHLPQVAVEVPALQNIGLAVVLVRQVDHAAERGHVLQQLVAG